MSDENLNEPKEGLNYFKSKFNVNLEAERMKAYRKMREICLKQNEEIRSFLDRLDHFAVLIEAAGGIFNNDHTQIQI